MQVDNIASKISHSIFLVLVSRVTWIPFQKFICQFNNRIRTRLPFYFCNRPSWKIHSYSVNSQRQYHPLRWVIRICNYNRVGLICLVRSKKFRNFIDGHVIHTGLYRKKKVMLQVGNTYRLVNNQVVCLPCNCMVTYDYTARFLISTVSQ